MYNMVDRSAMFGALRDRPEFQAWVPVYRIFYGSASRIWLRRGGGTLMYDVIEGDNTPGMGAAALIPDGADDGTDIAVGVDSPDVIQCKVRRSLMSCCGVNQG